MMPGKTYGRILPGDHGISQVDVGHIATILQENLAGRSTQILIALLVHHLISRLRYGWHHVRREKKDLEPEG